MYILAIILIIVGIVIDQVTKAIVIKHIFTGTYNGALPITNDITVIEGFFKITYAENTGGGWSIFQGKLWFFYIVTIIALIAFGYFMKDLNFQKYPIYSISLILMIIGTIGNFIDRIIHQYVVDFLDFIIFGYDFPTFNFADMCLTTGVIGLMIAIVFHKSPA
ncbi:MAG: signal peptidase II [Bacilli bacterium]|nr:signal peptidase II [Bacilli bacterium]